MSMSIRPLGAYPTTSYTAPAAPAAPVAPIAAPAPAPVMVRNDVMGNTLSGARDFLRSAMTGEPGPAGTLKSTLLGLVQKGQAVVGSLASRIGLVKPAQMTATADAAPLTLMEKAKKIGKAALFFALPVGGATLVALGLGGFVGPWVPLVGSKALGMAVGALAVGHTAGLLLHGSMRMPLVTDPADREYNSAGATVASAGIGAAVAAMVAGAAGATVGAPVLLAGAAIGAAPRILEWAAARL